MAEPLLIVGGTARAAAQSAKRAGFAPLALDRYGDIDLSAICLAHCKIGHIVDVLPAGGEFAGIPWMFTGPVENFVNVIAALCETSPLWGCDANAVSGVRDPTRLATALRDAGLLAPQVACDTRCPRSGNWLRKPLSSSGGAHITRVVSDKADLQSNSTPCYFQQYIAGLSCAATFLADGARANLIGVCEQLIGEHWTGSTGFHYAGSVGPLELATAQRNQLDRVGNCLAQTFRLRGLFGVDFISNQEGAWPIEVNPRYTASVEVLEQATSFVAVTAHAAACRDAKLPDSAPLPSGVVCGKAIVYARRRLTVSPADTHMLLDMNEVAATPEVADLPKPGTTIDTGQPVVSVFAAGSCSADVKERLRKRVTRVRTWLQC